QEFWQVSRVCVFIGTAARHDPSPLAQRGLWAAFVAMHGLNLLQDLLYFVRDPWPWGKPHEAAGLHHHCWWRGCRVAARCADTAAGKPGDRILAYAFAGGLSQLPSLSQRRRTNRLCGRAERADRISLGGGPLRSASGDGSRSGPPTSERTRGGWRRTF